MIFNSERHQDTLSAAGGAAGRLWVGGTQNPEPSVSSAVKVDRFGAAVGGPLRRSASANRMGVPPPMRLLRRNRRGRALAAARQLTHGRPASGEPTRPSAWRLAHAGGLRDALPLAAAPCAVPPAARGGYELAED